MAITVKRLIQELEKIDNRLLEVEVNLLDKDSLTPEIMDIAKLNKKVMIYLKRN